MYFEIFDGEFHGMMDWLNMLPMWAWMGIGALIVIVGSIIIYNLIRHSENTHEARRKELTTTRDQEIRGHSTGTVYIPSPTHDYSPGTIYCPHCGQKARQDTRFCPNCGSSMD